MERCVESLHSCFQEVINENAITNFDDIQEKADLKDEESESFSDSSTFSCTSYFFILNTKKHYSLFHFFKYIASRMCAKIELRKKKSMK